MFSKDKLSTGLILFVFLGVIIGSVVIRVNLHNTEEKQRLESLYYEQNTAFRLTGDYNDRNHYHGSDKLDLKDLSVRLFAFNSLNPEYELTVDDVVDYLSEEYDSQGKLKINTQPESISAYIEWSIHGGQSVADDFRFQLIDYAKSTTNKKYSEMTYEEIVELLEEYKNSSEYEPPQN